MDNMKFRRRKNTGGTPQEPPKAAAAPVETASPDDDFDRDITASAPAPAQPAAPQTEAAAPPDDPKKSDSKKPFFQRRAKDTSGDIPDEKPQPLYRQMKVPEEQRVKPEKKKVDTKAFSPEAFAPESVKQSAPKRQIFPSKDDSVSFFGKLKERAASLLGKSEQYYIPAGTGDFRSRTRYKTRNRKPVPLWLRATLTTLGITAFFTLLVCIVFSAAMSSRINYVGGGGRTAVRISGAEQEVILSEQTEEFENTSEFTEPNRIAEPSKDVEVIMVVSSSATLDATSSSECDAIMFIGLDYKHKKIKLVPVMRDLYVRIGGYQSNCISRAFYYDAASGSYSLPTMMQAVQDNLGIIPDHYIIVDSSAFITLITRIGGISLELSEEEALYMSTDEKYGYFPRFTAGGQYLMSGAETLNYIRIKKVGNGEYDRTVRQRAVMEQIFKKINDMSFIELCETAYALLPMLPTDLEGGDMLDILLKARRLSDYETSYLTIPITGAWRPGTAQVQNRSFEVMVTDFAFTADALQKYLYEDDQSYINGTAASGVTIPDVAPYIDPNPPEEEPDDAAEGEEDGEGED
ncbi:MAG: LCP family protein [Clostridia bacterium]|nr:LCP family protein [Clostridia bacterium]